MLTRRLAPCLCMIMLAVPVLGAEPSASPAPLSQDAPAQSDTLVGFWRIDLDAMRADPRFKETLDSPQGSAGVQYALGVMLEFSLDHHLRTHMGGVDDRPATVSAAPNGTFTVQPEGAAAWIVTPLSDDALIQTFPGVDFKILWARSWDPFVGTWRVSMDALENEHWYSSQPKDQRDVIRPEGEALRITVDEKGAVSGHWDGADRHATLALESTTPPAASIGEAGAAPSAHIVRSGETGATLYQGSRSWPLERVHPPSGVVVGTWKFDMDRIGDLAWLKSAVPEGKTFDEFIRESIEQGKIKIDTEIEVTPTEWNHQPYTVVDERGDQFSAQANNTIVFWVRVFDDDHISQFANAGREIPLVRVKADADAPAP